MSPRPRRRSPGAGPSPSGNDLYSMENIIDAPEHHEYARAMGLLTWGTWAAEKRPFSERLEDFLRAYPPGAPTRFQGSILSKTSAGEYGPAPEELRLVRLR